MISVPKRTALCYCYVASRYKQLNWFRVFSTTVGFVVRFLSSDNNMSERVIFVLDAKRPNLSRSTFGAINHISIPVGNNITHVSAVGIRVPRTRPIRLRLTRVSQLYYYKLLPERTGYVIILYRCVQFIIDSGRIYVGIFTPSFPLNYMQLWPYKTR